MSVSTAPLVATELRLHRRHHVLAATGAMTALWVPLLVALPAPWRADALAWLLLLDIATLGLYFAPALAVVERANGVTAALRLTRLTPLRALAVRVATLALWAVGAAAVLLAVTRVAAWPTVLLGVVLTSVLFSLLAIAMVGRAETLTTYLARVPLVAGPLLLPALLRGTGLVDSPMLALSPVTGALDLLTGRWSAAHAGWLLVAIGLLGLMVVRLGFDVRPQRFAPAGRWPTLRPFAGPRWWRVARSYATTDVRTLLGDRLLLLLLVGVPIIAVAVRVASGVGLDWLEQRHGVDASQHLPVMWAFVLVVHLPVMAGTLAGLLFLEDRDADLLPALTTTRASLHTLLAYRLTVTVTAAAAFMAAGMLIAGVRHPLGWPGLLLTALAGATVSVVPAMLLASLGRDRVQGMALMKMMGLPLYVPIAWWYVDGPAGWLFGLIPTGWAAQTFWATSVPQALGFGVGAMASSAVLAVVLARHLLRSVT
ncbi:MAG: hypothetical protein GEV09_13965 [Pseudonocardiaceae bacterium]|nr:hypothetical protein [Pseudonocardiaceae bacterium]